MEIPGNENMEAVNQSGHDWKKIVSIIVAIIVVGFIILIAIGRGGPEDGEMLTEKDKKEIRKYLSQEIIVTAEEKAEIRRSLAQEVVL